MNKIILKTLMIFCLITSCKTKGVSSDAVVNECELFKIGNFVFYNPRVYERPVIFEKGGHELLHKEYTPVWYAGYCAENLPSYFSSEDDYIRHVFSEKLEHKSLPYYSQVYKVYKAKPEGFAAVYHDDYHLLFRGTVSVKNLTSGNEYLLVAGKSYISNESDYDKNTDFYKSDVKSMFAYLLEDGVYKAVDIDYVIGTFTKPQHDKVYDILNTKTLVNSLCVENVNTIKKADFNSLELPKWVYNKSELELE